MSTAGAAQPELLQPHTTRALALLDQQRGDEEAGHDEEHLDAEESTVHPREPGVIQHHGRDRDRPQPVEPRLVAHRCRGALGRQRIGSPACFEVGQPRQGAVFEDVSH
jgi:hypothetical protein